MLSDKYIAGLLDSDGSISLHYQKRAAGGFYVHAVVNFNESPKKSSVLLDVNEALGGNLSLKESNGGFGPHQMRNLVFAGKSAISTLNRLEKFLVVKHGLVEFVCSANGRIVTQAEKDELATEIKNVRRTGQRLPNFLSRKWLAAYIDGNGCFTGGLRKATNKFEPKIDVAAWSEDVGVLELMKKQYGGSVYKGSNAAQTVYWNLSLMQPSKCIEFLEYLEHVIIVKPQRDYILSLARNGGFREGDKIRANLMALNSRVAQTKPLGVGNNEAIVG